MVAAAFVWLHPDLIAASYATASAKITVDQPCRVVLAHSWHTGYSGFARLSASNACPS